MPSRRALIIASPFEGLRGTLNDAKDMAGALQNHGFDITECYSSSATRSGILEAWKQLIAATRRGDSVVIYYSGHGGIVQAPEKDKSTQEKGARWRCQFLVPVDYDQTTDDDFRGILDVQISYMLRDTTNKTPNVTIILDCCHSGRLFRAPGYGDQARPKNLLDVQYHSTVEHLTRLRDAGHFRREADDVHGETTFSGNPHAVRIAAAASAETAWEYLNSRSKWTGALTEALVRVLDYFYY